MRWLSFWTRSRPPTRLIPERVVLLGFSQGAVMSLGAQALRPDSVAAVIALSGYFPIEVEAGRRQPGGTPGLRGPRCP